MKDNLPKQMIELMSDGGWHSRDELLGISHRFSATMHTLKKEGYQFEKKHVRRQEYKYRLILKDLEKSA